VTKPARHGFSWEKLGKEIDKFNAPAKPTGLTGKANWRRRFDALLAMENIICWQCPNGKRLPMPESEEDRRQEDKPAKEQESGVPLPIPLHNLSGRPQNRLAMRHSGRSNLDTIPGPKKLALGQAALRHQTLPTFWTPTRPFSEQTRLVTSGPGFLAGASPDNDRADPARIAPL